jgi:1,2-diacylglycerol 3-alpha-glucosyltransferase
MLAQMAVQTRSCTEVPMATPSTPSQRAAVLGEPAPVESSRLRIAYVVDSFRGRLGGGVVAGRYLVEQLRQQHQVTVIASDVDAPGDVKLKGFQLPLKSMRRMEFVMAVPNRAALSAAFAEVDVVHLAFPFWLSFAALREARRAGLPVVATFHVQPENVLYNLGRHWAWLSRWMYRFWVGRFYNRVDAVICPTQFAERKLRQHGLKVPTFVVSNGIPPDLARLPSRREMDPNGHFVICSVGRLAPEKRQDVLIEAVKHSRHRDRIKLVIGGAGPTEEALRKRAADLPIPADIGFHERGWISQLLSTADLMVHCGEVELEGIAVLEGMAFGLPVVVAQSSESASSEFALDDRFRFIAGDPRDLASRIDHLIENPAERARAGREYQLAAHRFDVSNTVSAVVEVYREAIAKHGVGASRESAERAA